MRVTLRIVVVLLAAVLCGWAFLRWSYAPLACSHAVTDLTRRTNLVERTNDPYVRVQRARNNLAELRALHCSTDVRIPMLIGANEMFLGQYEDALKAFRSALAIDRRPEIYTASGEALIQLGRTDEAVDAYVEATRFTPYALDDIPSEVVAERVKRRLGVR